MRPTASGARIGTHSAVRSRAVGRGRCWGRLGGEARRAGSPHTWHCPRPTTTTTTPLRHPPCHGPHPTDLHTHPTHTAMAWPVAGSEAQRPPDSREQGAWRVGLGRASIHQPCHAHSGAHTPDAGRTRQPVSHHMGKTRWGREGAGQQGHTRAGGWPRCRGGSSGRPAAVAGASHAPGHSESLPCGDGITPTRHGPAVCPVQQHPTRRPSCALDPHRAPCRRPVWRNMASNLAARFPGPDPPAGLPILPIIPLRGDDRSGSSTGPRD